MKQFIQGLAFASVLLPFTASAQSARDSVESTVRQLFTGMKNADSALVSQCFAPTAIQQTVIVTKEGKESVRSETVAEFIKSIARLSKGDADEHIVIASLNIDGGLASVWTPYRFFYKGKFIHCGANSFQLVRCDTGWKIQYLIDTRRKQGCE